MSKCFKCASCAEYECDSCNIDETRCEYTDKLSVNSVYNTDGLILLQEIYDELGSESVDMILCDLPYTYKGKNRVTANKWDLPIDIEKFFDLANKVITRTGVICLTATQPFSSYLVSTVESMSSKECYKNKNFINFKYEWIWEKDNGSNFVNVKHQPFRVHESVLVFGKSPTTYNKNNEYMCYNPQFTYGSPYVMKRDMSNVENLEGFKGRTDTNNEDGKRYPRSVQKFNLERGLHPTQKPVKLFEYLIKTHSNEGDLIVDICAGSGTTAIASLSSNRNFIVNDIEYKYFETINDRIKNYMEECK